jgi:hypothetical protein
METQAQNQKIIYCWTPLNEYFFSRKNDLSIDCSKTIKEELTVLDSVQSLKGDVFL